LDGIRELNTILRRDGSTVYDAIRGGRIMERLGRARGYVLNHELI
jgi:hypothetical protein